MYNICTCFLTKNLNKEEWVEVKYRNRFFSSLFIPISRTLIEPCCFLLLKKNFLTCFLLLHAFTHFSVLLAYGNNAFSTYLNTNHRIFVFKRILFRILLLIFFKQSFGKLLDFKDFLWKFWVEPRKEVESKKVVPKKCLPKILLTQKKGLIKKICTSNIVEPKKEVRPKKG